ncbi:MULTISPECIES: UDP-2,3-diacylglucosamine diphosphatase [unclassified Sphingomonas]|uniref:UDP-2,3-diacylglucosamine diphosphatase n=1 Tax=unclassified Sphingomonas TaxID=196159 RepID=UPI00092816F0|nr:MULTISPECIES: UDP-2,3-diacylglucosamine diphosphatase [unclassified Sphingomonas]MBN8849092.1 UDP-2,3-diacylglucosamine diphosphatase [Sphingomonas sp.]OJV29366.1 MAG: UDP-2,3-diacylglucosamine hydrolase [Sphingomonas sp. 67-36]
MPTTVLPIAAIAGDIADLADFTNSRPHLPERMVTERRRYRTIWISDVHLGTRGCNADMLIDFLDHVDSETMYLVGDMIDGWRLKKKFYWPASHNDVVWRLLKRARRGTRMIYIPGNHDEVFRQFSGLDFGGIAIRRKAIHETADGKRLLVLHGDEFDAITLAHRWLAHVGDAAYHVLMALNRWVNAVRRRLDLPYWSLSKHAKAKVKNAVAFISHFEEVVAHAAGSRGVDGVVCGHIHTAEIREIAGIRYYNDGDWVEGCTALVEHFDGRMEVLHWADEMAARAGDTVVPLAA